MEIGDVRNAHRFREVIRRTRLAESVPGWQLRLLDWFEGVHSNLPPRCVSPQGKFGNALTHFE